MARETLGIRRLRSLLHQDDYKKLASNVFSLIILQGANYILPLVTLPYLIRVLGVEYIGLLAFSTAIVAYLQIITDYGFDLSATKEVSINRANQEKLIEIFSSVITIKFFLMTLSFGFLCAGVFLFDRLRQDYEIYLLTFGLVIGNVLFPIWFFQGVERMIYITYCNVAAKLFFTIAIFLLVKDETHYYLVPLLSSAGIILSGSYSLSIVYRKYGVAYRPQSMGVLKRYLTDGWHVFLSRLYASLYTTTNIIILGLFTNNSTVGYYSIAEKITSALTGLYSPITRAFYPFFSRIHALNRNRFYKIFNSFNLIMLGSSLMMTFVAFLLSESIIEFVTGELDDNVLLIFSVLLTSVITAPFGPSFTNGLLVLGKGKIVSNVVRNTLLLNMALVFPLIYFYQGLGLALVVTVRSLFHALNYYYSYSKIIREVSERSLKY